MKKELIITTILIIGSSILTYSKSLEQDLLDRSKTALKQQIEEYLESRKTSPDKSISKERILDSVIEDLITKCKTDLAAPEYKGEHKEALRLYNVMLANKKKLANDILLSIDNAKQSNNQPVLIKHAIDSLEEDLRDLKPRMIDSVAGAMQAELNKEDSDVIYAKELEKLSTDYWRIKNQLLIIRDNS